MGEVMTQKFRLYRRGSNARYYIQDNATGKQETLGTSDKVEALRLLMARNEADQQPAFNAQIAKTYLAAGEVRLGDLQIQRGLSECLILCKDALLGGITVFRLEPRTCPGVVVEAVESALAVVDQSVTILHRHQRSLEEK